MAKMFRKFMWLSRTTLIFPLPYKDDMATVTTVDAVIAKYVFTIALVWPSASAKTEFKLGKNTHRKRVPMKANKSE
jgi:hypothetical protein